MVQGQIFFKEGGRGGGGGGGVGGAGTFPI